MTPTRLAEIRARLEKATPLEDTGHSQLCSCTKCGACWERAAAFQAYAPQSLSDIADLLEEVGRLKSLILKCFYGLDRAPFAESAGPVYDALRAELWPPAKEDPDHG